MRITSGAQRACLFDGLQSVTRLTGDIEAVRGQQIFQAIKEQGMIVVQQNPHDLAYSRWRADIGLRANAHPPSPACYRSIRYWSDCHHAAAAVVLRGALAVSLLYSFLNSANFAGSLT